MNGKSIARAVALVGLAACAVWLELAGKTAGWVWAGVFFLFLSLL